MSTASSPEVRLSRRDYFFLFLAGLVVALVIAAMQPVPGYIDADYYYAGGMQLAGGHGFTEPFLWNYLDNPQSLPHPSNTYWYPLASMIAAAGMFIAGRINFVTARIGFVLMAALAPLVAAGLAYHLTGMRRLALVSGILAIFSGYYLPFIVTTDNYSLYLLLGGLFFLILNRLASTNNPKKGHDSSIPNRQSSIINPLLLGLIAGLLNLARGDGLLWLPLTVLAVSVLGWRQSASAPVWTRLLRSAANGCLALLGYLLVMGGWMLRNLYVFGAILPPGGNHVLWMTRYNQIYSYTPQIYTFQSWLANGWKAILAGRLNAIWQNLGTAVFAEGMLILIPLILAGMWKHRHSFVVQMAVLGWLALLLAESLLFPLASVSGGFFHAGTAFQPLWFALAPAGLEAIFTRLTKKNDKLRQTAQLVHLSFLLVVILFSAMLVKIRVINSGWNEGEYLYQNVEQFLVSHGAQPDDIVMVRNPPGYFIMTERQAVAIPYNDLSTLLEASHKFSARYVILEEAGMPAQLMDLYDHPEKYPELTYLGEVERPSFPYIGALDESRIFYVK